jgi:hypothetical protein
MRCPRRDSSSETGASNHALRTQRLRMDRHQMTVACSMESFGSCVLARHGATCRRTMVPAPLVIIASFGGGGLASGTGSWMHGPPVMTRRCKYRHLGRLRAPARSLHRRQQSSRYGSLTRWLDQQEFTRWTPMACRSISLSRRVSRMIIGCVRRSSAPCFHKRCCSQIVGATRSGNLPASKTHERKFRRNEIAKTRSASARIYIEHAT